jgi:acid phosphatase type 7
MNHATTRLRLLPALVLLLLPLRVAVAAETIKQTVDGIVTRMYATLTPEQLAALDDAAVQKFITAQERHVLAGRYWCFDANVPVVVSVIRDRQQPVVPFWLPETGFRKTALTVKNSNYQYEVWQKTFAAGRIGLGINGFDNHRPHYFVAIGPQKPGAKLELTGFSPANQTVSVLRKGASTYHDWNELVLTEMPESLRGQSLLPTIRGRAREAHLVQAFRRTPFPSSSSPDLIALTWSDDPRTTQTVQWRTSAAAAEGAVRYWEKAASRAGAVEVKGACSIIEDRLLSNDRRCHRFTAVLRPLKPATTYVYSVGNPTSGVWSAEREFTTAPDGDAPFTFVFLGDTHRSPIPGQLLSKALLTHPRTAFAMIAGDLVSTGLYRDDWDHFFTYGGEFFSRRPVVPCIGNHDDQDGLGASMYLSMFALPRNGPKGIEAGRAYSFRYSNALFVVLDIGSPVPVQAAWLDDVLSKTDTRWKFVMFHFPPFGNFSHDSEYGEIVKHWWALFDKYHVDVVLNGHIHRYVRTYPLFAGKRVESTAKGTVYIVSVAIPNRAPHRPPPTWVAKLAGDKPLYQTFEINGPRCLFRAYDLDGHVEDETILTK